MNIKALLKSGAGTLLIKSVAVSTTFLITMFVARTLSIDDAGKFFFLFSIVTFFSIIVRSGLDNPMIRFSEKLSAPQYQSDLAWLLKNSLLWVLLVSLIIAITLYLWNYMVGKQDNGMIFFTIPGIALTFLVGCCLQSTINPILGSFFKNALIPLIFGAILTIQYFTNTLNPYLAFFIAGSISIAIISVIITHYLKRAPASTSQAIKQEVKSSSITLFMVQLIQQLNKYAAVFILAAFVSNADYAQFSVAHRISFVCSFFLVALNNVVAPKLARIDHQKEKQALQQLISNTAKILWLVAISLSLFVFFSADFLISFFGSEYDSASLLLKIMVIGGTISSIVGPVGYLLTMNGFEKTYRNINFITLIISCLLAITLIPMFGVIGAAVSTSLTLCISNLLTWLYVKKLIGINSMKFW